MNLIMGGSNENSVYGVVRNPININKVLGGSSGGSSSMISQMCLVALEV